MNVVVSLLLLLSSGAYGMVQQDVPENGDSYSVRLITQEKEPISRHLMGFNAVYAYEADSVWSDGKVEGYLKDVNTSVMRYPAGTVCSFYHWDNPTGEGWKDSWDPNNKVTPKPNSEFMDLDEFIALAQRSNITPLLGINMSSGWRWNRMEEGIQEALALMDYCRTKNFNVKYWYLDNEPYQPDSNGGSKTIEEYAGLVNQFASRMKAFKPDIKIIVNWNSAFEKRRDEYQKLLSIAGENIDIIDGHWYWSWSKPTYEKWLEKTPMQVWTGGSYMSEIAYFRQMVKDFGYPDIKLASLEWNVGPIKEEQLTPHQCALIQSEMMMQFILGGLDMATFWPLQGVGDALTTRSFVRRSDRTAQPAYSIFQFLGKIQGCSLIKSESISSEPNILDFVALDGSENIVRVCLLNKNGTGIRAHFDSDIFMNRKLINATAFVLKTKDNGSALQAVKLSEHNGSGISFNAPGTSLTMLTFEKE